MSAPGTAKRFDPDTQEWVPVFVGARGISGIHKSDTPPDDTGVLWLDTEEVPDYPLPTGGEEGEVLTKNSGAEDDVSWQPTLVTGLREIITFTSDGSFIKANYPWLRAVRVRLVGGGGSGGGADVTTSAQVSGGGGGGSGAYAESLISVSELAAAESVTIGAGAAATVTNGQSGGTTSFGSHVSADGGSGGIRRGSGGPPRARIGGAGGAGGTGDVVVPGTPGGFMMAPTTGFDSVSGFGGASLLGGGGESRHPAALAGHDAPGRGGGGGGALASNADEQLSGKGGDGVVVIELYG